MGRSSTSNGIGKKRTRSNVADENDHPMIRVGIVGIWSQGEAKKSELVSILKKTPPRPWLEGIKKDFIVVRPFNETYEIEGNTGVATDVAVGAYIEYAYASKNVAVDFIPPNECTKERLARNDLNFHILYDSLEGFHGDRSKGKRVWKRIEEALDTSNNVFPPRYYQKLINNKISYYNWCKKNDVRICPTFTLTKEEYAAEAKKHKAADEAALHAALANHYWDKIQGFGWGFRFFCKPVYGIESRDAKMFTVAAKNEQARFRKYFSMIMRKYPGIVIQKYIIGFGAHTDMPESRHLHIGEEYQYTIIQTDDKTYRPDSEDYVYNALSIGKDFPLEKMKAYAREVMNKLPEFKVQGVSLPRLTTRIDLGLRLHPAGLPDLEPGKEITIQADGESVKAMCLKKDITKDGIDTGYVGAIKCGAGIGGATGIIIKIDGGDNTVQIRYTGKHEHKGFHGKGWYPIETIEGYNPKEEITPFVNEIEYCPSLFVEETLKTIDQVVGDQMVNITRQFVNERGPTKKKEGSPMKEMTRHFCSVANISDEQTQTRPTKKRKVSKGLRKKTGSGKQSRRQSEATKTEA